MSTMDHNKKDYLNKSYKNFSELIHAAATRELEYFILKGEFTSAFNYRVKKMLEELRRERGEFLDASVFFNTKGEITLIDAQIVGRFIQDNYKVKVEDYYKNVSLNKIIRQVVNGSEKVKADFTSLSYSILYDTLNELYKNISCKKEDLIIYKNRYALDNYHNTDVVMVIQVLLILEDLCKYIGIERHKMLHYIQRNISIKNK